MGPLQFIPSSWAIFGVDLNGDGAASPNNVFDAAGAAVKHLCGTAPVNLADAAALSAALLGYNHSHTYVLQVSSWITRFDQLTTGRIQLAQQVAPSVLAAAILAAAMSWVGKATYSWGGGSSSGPSTGVCCSPGGQDGSRGRGLLLRAGYATQTEANNGWIPDPHLQAVAVLPSSQVPLQAAVVVLMWSGTDPVLGPRDRRLTRVAMTLD